MLVLTRGRQERVMIGDDIIITVLSIRGETVKLGINAPRDVGVHREEIYDALTTDGERLIDKYRSDPMH